MASIKVYVLEYKNAPAIQTPMSRWSAEYSAKAVVENGRDVKIVHHKTGLVIATYKGKEPTP